MESTQVMSVTTSPSRITMESSLLIHGVVLHAATLVAAEVLGQPPGWKKERRGWLEVGDGSNWWGPPISW
jgi:hypothetical protein